MAENKKTGNPFLGKKLLVASIWLLLAISAASYYLTGIRLAGILPGCMFLRTTGLFCPGCGGTRAMQYLLEGDIITSLRYNFLALTGTAIFIISLMQYTINIYFNKKFKVLITYDFLLWSGAIAIFAYWAIRNII